MFRKGQVVKHLKTGGIYKIIGLPDEGYIIEETGELAYVYTDGFLRFVRSVTKMEDGRFVKLEKRMQTGTEQLKNQQEVMAAKNFYSGKIDGEWGPASIEAKIKWERSGKFNPALPNGGLPFASKGALPMGVRRLPDGSLTCPELEVPKALAKREARVIPPTPVVTPKNDASE